MIILCLPLVLSVVKFIDTEILFSFYDLFILHCYNASLVKNQELATK